jgi:hypothetical protein
MQPIQATVLRSTESEYVNPNVIPATARYDKVYIFPEEVTEQQFQMWKYEHPEVMADQCLKVVGKRTVQPMVFPMTWDYNAVRVMRSGNYVIGGDYNQWRALTGATYPLAVCDTFKEIKYQHAF